MKHWKGYGDGLRCLRVSNMDYEQVKVKRVNLFQAISLFFRKKENDWDDFRSNWNVNSNVHKNVVDLPFDGHGRDKETWIKTVSIFYFVILVIDRLGLWKLRSDREGHLEGMAGSIFDLELLYVKLRLHCYIFWRRW